MGALTNMWVFLCMSVLFYRSDTKVGNGILRRAGAATTIVRYTNKFIYFVIVERVKITSRLNYFVYHIGLDRPSTDQVTDQVGTKKNDPPLQVSRFACG